MLRRLHISRFQSTHPGWGATKIERKYPAKHADFNPRTPGGVRLYTVVSPVFVLYISIHAPRVGCDFHSIYLCKDICDFNPRTPGGVRLPAIIVAIPTRPISIHAPRVGCDGDDARYNVAVIDISIHAPRVGCDTTLPRPNRYQNKFQSTHPGWGATCMTVMFGLNPIFQSTHPGWGATRRQRVHLFRL